MDNKKIQFILQPGVSFFAELPLKSFEIGQEILFDFMITSTDEPAESPYIFSNNSPELLDSAFEKLMVTLEFMTKKNTPIVMDQSHLKIIKIVSVQSKKIRVHAKLVPNEAYAGYIDLAEMAANDEDLSVVLALTLPRTFPQSVSAFGQFSLINFSEGLFIIGSSLEMPSDFFDSDTYIEEQKVKVAPTVGVGQLNIYNLTEEDTVSDAEEPDNIEAPSHYNDSPIETFEMFLLFAQDKPEYIKGALLFNIFKYRDRAGKKKGNSEDEDTQKMLWYLDKMVEFFPNEVWAYNLFHEIRLSQKEEKKRGK